MESRREDIETGGQRDLEKEMQIEIEKKREQKRDIYRPKERQR